MPDELAEAQAKLKRIESRLADMDDSLARMVSLWHLGNLAAEGLHDLTRSCHSIAITYYFTLLRDELNTLQKTFSGGEEGKET